MEKRFEKLFFALENQLNEKELLSKTDLEKIREIRLWQPMFHRGHKVILLFQALIHTGQSFIICRMLHFAVTT